MSDGPSAPPDATRLPSLYELLQRTRAGDLRAQQELFRRLRLELRWRAARMLGEQRPMGMQASDMANEASARLFTHLANFDGTTDAELRSYSYKLLERLVLQHQRDAKRQIRDERGHVALDAYDSKLAADQPSQSELLRGKERQQSLWAVLPRLTEAQAHALLLKYEGATLTEIAAALGRDETAASSVLYRAIKALHRELGRALQEGEKDGRALRAFRQYLFAVERGEAPERQAYLAGHREVAAPLGEMLDGLDWILAQLREAEREEDARGRSPG